jgi:hypothetical protein
VGEPRRGEESSGAQHLEGSGRSVSAVEARSTTILLANNRGGIGEEGEDLLTVFLWNACLLSFPELFQANTL